MVRRLREMINENRPAFGLWIGLADPAIVEIAGYAGYDYVVIDMEHTTIELPMVENMVRAATCAGISVMVRVPGNDPHVILRVAELGADGLFIPHVKDAADARKAVMAAKYAPIGDRGVSSAMRASRYGSVPDFARHTSEINRDLIIYAQIEDLSAVADIENIAAVEGLDICGPAASDLARALGVTGSYNDELLKNMIHDLAEAIRRVGKAKLALPIMHSSLALDVDEVIALGAVMINASTATKTLLNGLRDNIQRARANLPH